MSNGFRSKRSILWLSGIAVLVLGFLAAAILLPMTSKVAEPRGPDVHVPKMQNVPSAGAPKIKLQLERQPQQSK